MRRRKGLADIFTDAQKKAGCGENADRITFGRIRGQPKDDPRSQDEIGRIEILVVNQTSLWQPRCRY